MPLQYAYPYARVEQKVLYTTLLMGCNQTGNFGSPISTLAAALRHLSADGLEICAVSMIYKSLPQGGGRQPDYFNMAAMLRTTLPPATLLRRLKTLERLAGRRQGRIWGPRPLDIDIIDCGGMRIGRPSAPRRAGQLVLPHPLAHKRVFVLKPLLDVAPHWQHPVLRRGARALLYRLGPQQRTVRVAAPAPALAELTG